jgi:proteasome lid subunit RPN8/RPN11
LAGTANTTVLPTVYCPRGTAASMQAEAERCFPYESCGLLAGLRTDSSRTLTIFLPVPNQDSRRDRFTIDGVDFARAEAQFRDLGLAWLGFAHSHPEGSAALSDLDRRLLWRCCVQVIVPVRAGRAGTPAVYWLEPDGTAPALQLRMLP